MGDSKKRTRVARNPGTPHSFPCIVFKQGKFDLAVFVANAKEIWEFSKVNRREPDKQVGYQRVLNQARVASLRKYIEKGNPIPNSVLLALDSGYVLDDSSNPATLNVERIENAAWVIDGQHRLSAASEATVSLEMVAIAFLGLNAGAQVEQFVTINREAKGVPTSLYLDLLSSLPSGKSDKDIANERASDIVNMLRLDEESPFYQKISVVTSPQKGQISNTNFVRKVSPILRNELKPWTTQEQAGILNNYFSGLQQVFPNEFKEPQSLFFRTIGFGAMINALPDVFNLVHRKSSGFGVADVVKTLRLVEDFDFSQWGQMGTGTAAENVAGTAFRTFFEDRTKDEKKASGLRL